MNNSLPAATLAIYIALALPTLYTLFRHGLRHGAILGWGFLFIFTTLKIVAGAMQLKDSSSPSAALISSIGLSPLLLAFAGLIHESRAYCTPNRNRLFDLVWVVFVHFGVSTAVALTAVGASGASKADATPDARLKDINLTKGGMAILVLAWVSSTLLAFTTFLRRARGAGTSHGLVHAREGSWLLYAVLAAVPFVGIRIIASLVYYSTQNQELNPATGEIGHRVGLYFIEEVTVSILFVLVGICTRNIGNSQSVVRSEEYGMRR